MFSKYQTDYIVFVEDTTRQTTNLETPDVRVLHHNLRKSRKQYFVNKLVCFHDMSVCIP